MATVEVELPLDCTHPAAKNVRGMRLYACHCVRMVANLIKSPVSIEAVDVGERFANQQATFEELMRANIKARAIALETGELLDHAAAACAAYRADVPVADADSIEAASLFAARVASTAVRLAMINAGKRELRIDRDMLKSLRRFVPELFHLAEQSVLIPVASHVSPWQRLRNSLRPTRAG